LNILKQKIAWFAWFSSDERLSMRFSRANVLMSESCSGTHVWSTRKVIQKWGWGLTQPCWLETSGNTLVFQSPFRNSCGRLCREDRWRELPSAVCCRLRRRSNPAGGPGGSTWSTEELAMNGFIQCHSHHPIHQPWRVS
jgi:hypothetical protein